MQIKKQLPNASSVLVLGILSIVLSFCYGFIGIVLGIIALVISKKDIELYNENPDEWLGYQNITTGRICAIVGLCLGALVLIATICYFAFFFSYMMQMIQSAAENAH